MSVGRWSYNLSFHWGHVPLVLVHRDCELIWGWHAGRFAVVLMRYRL